VSLIIKPQNNLMTQVSVGVATTHPKLEYLKDRLDHTIQLSVEKAAAHFKNPAQYPLPAGKESLESAIIDLVKILPKRKQDKFLDTMKEALQATASARQQKYGALASIDLRKSTAIVDLVKDMPVPDEMKISTEELKLFKKQPGKKMAPAKKGYKTTSGPVQPRQAVPGTVLQFAVENITCIETNDLRKDEVSFSAFVTDSTGVTQERNNFFSADFKKGDSKSPGAAGNLFNINLGDSTGGVFPASFAGGVLIVEEGLFGGGDGVETTGAILRIIGKIISIGSLVTCFIPAAGLPIAFTIIGIGTALIVAGHILLFAGGDEISLVIPDELLFETPPFAGETFVRTVEIGFLDDGFIKKGKYAVNLRWTVA
jgi:hypothetical protein